jgi:hypothetical protein
MFYHFDSLVDETLSVCPLPGPPTSIRCGNNKVLDEDKQRVSELLEVWQWGNAGEDLPYHCQRRLCQEGEQQHLVELDTDIIQYSKINHLWK